LRRQPATAASLHEVGAVIDGRFGGWAKLLRSQLADPIIVFALRRSDNEPIILTTADVTDTQISDALRMVRRGTFRHRIEVSP
jgi:hypothetical protein